jgi:hypothetical protein
MVEEAMLQHEQLDLPVNHHFMFGNYARELFIPAGVLLTGKIHKYPQLNILIRGEITVLIGDRVHRLKAPYMVRSPAGIKRIAYTHEDTVWLTILDTAETDPERIEQMFTASTEEEYQEFLRLAGAQGQQCLS